MDLLFFVGEAEGCSTKVRLEVEQHGDVRQLPVPDQYDALPKKTLALMSVAAEHSPPVDFLVKIDDDVVLDAPWLSGAFRGSEVDGLTATQSFETHIFSPFLRGFPLSQIAS